MKFSETSGGGGIFYRTMSVHRKYMKSNKLIGRKNKCGSVSSLPSSMILSFPCPVCLPTVLLVITRCIIGQWA